MSDAEQRSARRALAHDARGLVTLFDRPVRRQLARAVRRALDGCPDHRAALRRHRVHQRDDILNPLPIFRLVDRLIADLDGARGGTGP